MRRTKQSPESERNSDGRPRLENPTLLELRQVRLHRGRHRSCATGRIAAFRLRGGIAAPASGEEEGGEGSGGKERTKHSAFYS